MPFKSESQRKKMISMAARGQISQEVLDKWLKETGDKPLPYRIKVKRPKMKKHK